MTPDFLALSCFSFSSHATALVQDGVSLATIRKRLGHKHIQTTLRYAEQSDGVADTELRTRRRMLQRKR